MFDFADVVIGTETRQYVVAPDTSRLPVVPYRLAIIKQKVGEVLERTFDPQTNPTMNEPIGMNKGAPVIIPIEWIEWMRNLMDAKAHAWWIRPDMMMVNRRHKYDGLYPPSTDECRFENIMLPCNFVAIDQLTPTHARLVSRKTSDNPKLLDPKVNNWMNEPWLFWKGSAHNKEGKIIKVGTELDMFTPAIRSKPELWANRVHLEEFPELPFEVVYEGKAEIITGYCLQGASVYGHALTRDIPLRLARTAGELIHPTKWMLAEKPVPV